MPRAIGPSTLDNLPHLFGPRALDSLLRDSAPRASGGTHTQYRALSDHALWETWHASSGQAHGNLGNPPSNHALGITYHTPSGQALWKHTAPLRSRAKKAAPTCLQPSRWGEHVLHAFGPRALGKCMPRTLGPNTLDKLPHAFGPRALDSPLHGFGPHARGENMPNPVGPRWGQHATRRRVTR